MPEVQGPPPLSRAGVPGDGEAAAAHFNRGAVLQGLGRPAEAVEAYREALRLTPDDPRICSNLGNALRACGRPAEALAMLGHALRLAPDLAEAHTNLGATLMALGRPAQAVASFREAVRLRPDLAVSWSHLAGAALLTGAYAEAERACRATLALVPDRAETHALLGAALGGLHRIEEAAPAYREAVRLKPGFAAAWSALGSTCSKLGRPAEAEAACREALRLKPDFADAHFNLALVLLSQGRLAEGWAEHEWRWLTGQMRAAHRGFVQPQWYGEAGEGRTLLIWAEQGLGDTLQFCRYVPLAVARGLRVVLGVPAPLVRLLGCLPATVIDSLRDLPSFDLHCPMLSLPLALGTTLETVPGDTPYLRADPAAASAWKARLDTPARGRPRVGLVWAGNPRNLAPELAAIDRRRSIPPDLLAPLLAIPGVCFVSLQKDGPAPPADFELIDPMAEVTDFADTAALVEGLDLVISVDTSVVHLAGALGKPVWLLDRFDHCWRWIDGRGDSPWYPGLRIYRQPRAGDWESAVAEASRDLRALATTLAR